MLTIEYSPKTGIPTADGVAEEEAMRWANRLKSVGNEKPLHLVTSSEILIMALRVLVLRGLIPFEQIQVKYQDQVWPFDKDARGFWDYPDYFQDFLMEIFCGKDGQTGFHARKRLTSL